MKVNIHTVKLRYIRKIFGDCLGPLQLYFNFDFIYQRSLVPKFSHDFSIKMKMPTITIIIFILFLDSSFGNIFGRKDDDILSIECGRGTLFGPRSPLCSRNVAENSTHPDISPNNLVNVTTPTLLKIRVPQILKNMSANPTIPKIAKGAYSMAKWTKVLIGCLVGILSIYSSVVSILKFRQNFGLRRAFSLGLFGLGRGRRASLPNDEPIPMGRREAETI